MDSADRCPQLGSDRDTLSIPSTKPRLRLFAESQDREEAQQRPLRKESGFDGFRQQTQGRDDVAGEVPG